MTRSRFAFLLGNVIHRLYEAIERRVHGGLPLADPVIDRLECGGLHAVGARTAHFPRDDDATILKNLEVFDGRRKPHLCRFGQFLDGGWTVAELFDHAAPTWVRQGDENTIELPWLGHAQAPKKS